MSVWTEKFLWGWKNYGIFVKSIDWITTIIVRIRVWDIWHRHSMRPWPVYQGLCPRSPGIYRRLDQGMSQKKPASRNWPMPRSSRPAPVAFLQSRILAAIRKASDTKWGDATGQNKAIEMIHERQYNKAGIKGCSGGLDSFVNDCGYRKSSHRTWYKKTGQVNINRYISNQ